MKGKFWRKALAVATSFLMLSGGVSVQPFADIFKGMAITASAAGSTESVTYVDEKGVQSVTATVLTGSESETTLSGGWYVAKGSIAYTQKLTLNGNVQLILADDAAMTVGSADYNNIALWCNSTLKIYGQTSQSGKLTVQCNSNAIGGDNLEIYGGDITVSGRNAIDINNNVKICGGNVSATATYNIAIRGAQGITISGGTVTATAPESGKALSGSLNITGGEVTANAPIKVENDESLTLGNLTFTLSGGNYQSALKINGYTTSSTEIQFTFDYDDYYHVSSVKLDDTDLTPDNDGVYTVTMPSSPQTVSMVLAANEYTITYTNATDGEDGVTNHNPTTYTMSDLFDLQEPTKIGYTFIGWTTSDGDDEYEHITIPNKYVMFYPIFDCLDRTFVAHWQVNQYALALPDNMKSTNDVTLTDGEADFGTEVKLGYTGESVPEGYDLIVKANDTVLTPDAGGIYSFTMPADDVTVTATFGYSDGIGAKLAGYSLSLDGDIGVNFYMELDQSVIEDTGAYMHFTLPDGSTSDVYLTDTDNCRIDTTTFPGKTYYVFKCNVAAKEMTDTITAQMFSGNKSGQGYEYTVKEYADYLLDNTDKNDDYAKAAPLVKAMLDYGSYAQIYFDHNAEALANGETDITNIQSVDADTIDKPYDPEGTYLKSAGDTTFEGATLSLKSETTLSLYFKSSRDLSFECDSYEVEKVTTAGGYQIARIRGIKADDLDKTFTLEIYDAAESERTGTFYGYVNYCPLTYCYNVLNGGSNDENLQNVCKALYLYWKAANEYSK